MTTHVQIQSTYNLVSGDWKGGSCKQAKLPPKPSSSSSSWPACSTALLHQSTSYTLPCGALALLNLNWLKQRLLTGGVTSGALNAAGKEEGEGGGGITAAVATLLFLFLEPQAVPSSSSSSSSSSPRYHIRHNHRHRHHQQMNVRSFLRIQILSFVCFCNWV